jgi:nitrite reductase/ring-hydroxylating ferredoxin subunit
MSEFISVADVASLSPGHGRTVQVDGRDYAIWNLDGQFYCIDDQCPHRGDRLGAGTLQNDTVFCPLHGWGFNLKTGVCLTRPDRGVKSYPTRVCGNQVQICI